MWFFLIASITLTLSPGPDIIYVLVQSMANGRQRGMAIAFGLVTGVLVHTSLVAFGVAILISQHEILYTLLKFFGSGYLLYLALKL
jgi:threonine/homoserine/homoserine lactone efflux protein